MFEVRQPHRFLKEPTQIMIWFWDLEIASMEGQLAMSYTLVFTGETT